MSPVAAFQMEPSHGVCAGVDVGGVVSVSISYNVKLGQYQGMNGTCVVSLKPPEHCLNP
jgi:hypothetical protein